MSVEEKSLIPIQILSRYHLAQKVELGGKLCSHCISITDPGEAMPEASLSSFQEVLRLQFHDIDRRGDLPRSVRAIVPRKSFFRRVLRFYKRTRPVASGYTIHCHAGIHRSTAIGLGILYLELGSERLATDRLLELRPLPMPNRRLVRLIDNVLGSNLSRVNEELWQRAKDYLNDRITIDPDDYLEELDGVE